MPFYFDKPVDFTTKSVSDGMIIIPTFIKFFYCFFSLFTIFINWLFVENHSTMISDSFLRIISKAINIVEYLLLTCRAMIIKISNCVTHTTSSPFSAAALYSLIAGAIISSGQHSDHTCSKEMGVKSLVSIPT